VPTPNPAHPAATVILLRDAASGPEIFMVRRSAGGSFMAGQHVFPGGRVDLADRQAAGAAAVDAVGRAGSHWPDLSPEEAVAYQVAAARELFEEAGVLLARGTDGQWLSLADAAAYARFAGHRRAVHAGALTLDALMAGETLRLALDTLVPWAHWVTPAVTTRRFDTRFFVARLPEDQTPVHDEAETTASHWTTAAGAIESAQRGDIVLPPPTWMTLRELEAYRSVSEILEAAAARDRARWEPLLAEEDGQRIMIMPGDPDFGDGGVRAGAREHPHEGRQVPAHETRFVWSDGHWRARHCTRSRQP
jgi:8-oxo-dGTP pyrophosphatase MutT (NUDIX family)